MSTAMGSEKNMCPGALGPGYEWAIDMPNSSSQVYEKRCISVMDLQHRRVDIASVFPRNNQVQPAITSDPQMPSHPSPCGHYGSDLLSCQQVRLASNLRFNSGSAGGNVLISMVPTVCNGGLLDEIPLSLGQVEPLSTQQLESGSGDRKSECVQQQQQSSNTSPLVKLGRTQRKICKLESGAPPTAKIQSHDMKSGDVTRSSPFQSGADVHVTSSRLSTQCSKYIMDNLAAPVYANQSHLQLHPYSRLCQPNEIQDSSTIFQDSHTLQEMQAQQSTPSIVLNPLKCPPVVYPVKAIPPAAGMLYQQVASSAVLTPVPAIHPGWDRRARGLSRSVENGISPSNALYFGIDDGQISPTGGGYVAGMDLAVPAYCDDVAYFSNATLPCHGDHPQEYVLQNIGRRRDAWTPNPDLECEAQAVSAHNKKWQVYYSTRRSEAESGEPLVSAVTEKSDVPANPSSSKVPPTGRKKACSQDSLDPQRAPSDRPSGSRLSATAARNFECRLCLKRFLRRQDLNRHEATHMTGYKPYHCTSCGIGFTRQDALHRHSKSGRCLGVPGKV